MEILNFPQVHTGYQDREERSVCAGCGSYYVVEPEELKQAQEILDDLYEALKAIINSETITGRDNFNNALEALSKAEVE